MQVVQSYMIWNTASIRDNNCNCYSIVSIHIIHLFVATGYIIAIDYYNCAVVCSAKFQQKTYQYNVIYILACQNSAIINHRRSGSVLVDRRQGRRAWTMG